MPQCPATWAQVPTYSVGAPTSQRRRHTVGAAREGLHGKVPHLRASLDVAVPRAGCAHAFTHSRIHAIPQHTPLWRAATPARRNKLARCVEPAGTQTTHTHSLMEPPGRGTKDLWVSPQPRSKAQWNVLVFLGTRSPQGNHPEWRIAQAIQDIIHHGKQRETPRPRGLTQRRKRLLSPSAGGWGDTHGRSSIVPERTPIHFGTLPPVRMQCCPQCTLAAQ